VSTVNDYMYKGRGDGSGVPLSGGEGAGGGYSL
jgi:hypothetical protein